MKSKKIWIAIIVFAIFLAISVALFCWGPLGKFSPDLAIDSERFSDFGSFIGGIFGFLSFILLLLTLKETREQSFDALFFNNLQLHDTIVQQLKSAKKEISTLNEEYKKLFEKKLCDNFSDSQIQEECKKYSNYLHDGYFEALYAILHVKYKYCGENPRVFFKENNWRIGHFLSSFISVVELIDNPNLTGNKKDFYVRLVNARATSTEVRLLFYFVSFNENENERLRLKTLFKSLNFFGHLKDGLIKQEDMQEFNSNS